ncbi:Efflux pump dotC [Erysiphe neolycopersici]|uniref:Efflux pump dotC n=1 Tax=Erysiphe neolycopersici TaxID=212602 RepID=A0A420HYD0_9PEZI|nr:Efflux pump dotC [Erysiphe neolycopersici]
MKSNASGDGSWDKPVVTDLEVADQTTSLSRSKIATVFLTCSAVDFAALFDQNTLAVALPVIGASLGASSQVSTIAAAYFITATSFQLIYGRLSDIWSRKLILIAGIAIFFLGSLGTSLARNITEFIAFRALTGIGGGGLVTLVQIIVGDVVSLRERGRWQGILGSVVAITYGISPIIGGKIASSSSDSWRWIFRLNLFTTAFTALMVIFFLPLKKVEGHWKSKLKIVDFFGAALSLAGSSLIIIGLSWGGVIFPWLSLHVIITLTLGGLTMMAFLLWEWKGAQLPVLPREIVLSFFKPTKLLMHFTVKMFNSRMVQATTVTTFTCGWNYFVQIFFIPSFYQLAYGYTPLRAAAMLLPIVVVQTVSSTLGGLIVTWRGRYRESLIFGYVLWCIGLGLHSSLCSSTGLAVQLIYGSLLGFGAGHTFQPSLIAMQAAVGKENLAVITGVRSFIRDLGGTFGLAIAGSIINHSLRKVLSYAALNGQAVLSSQQINEILEDPSQSSSLKDSGYLEKADAIRSLVLSGYFAGFRRVFYLSTALATVAIVATVFFIPQIDLSVEEKEEIEKARNSSNDKNKDDNSILKSI